MKLKEYSSFDDKSSRFGNQVMIDSSSDFDNWFNRHISEGETSFIYRGVSEAKFKIYSSAQRYWITQELSKSGKSFTDFVDSLIQELKAANNGLLPQYFKSFNIPANDFLYLSFLQHYQAPSTLIDFSYNLRKAVFFCFDNMTFVPSSRKIDNYCSLYILDPVRKGIYNDIISLPDFIENSIERVDEMLGDIKSKSPELVISTDDFKEEIKKLPYPKYAQTQLLYVPGSSKSPIYFTMRSIPYFISGFIISNLNIVAQEGAFIFYGDSKHPLEDFYQAPNPVQETFRLLPIECVNIHKSLKDYIESRYLISNNITHASMYPQEEQLASNCFTEFKKKI